MIVQSTCKRALLQLLFLLDVIFVIALDLAWDIQLFFNQIFFLLPHEFMQQPPLVLLELCVSHDLVSDLIVLLINHDAPVLLWVKLFVSLSLELHQLKIFDIFQSFLLMLREFVQSCLLLMDDLTFIKMKLSALIPWYWGKLAFSFFSFHGVFVHFSLNCLWVWLFNRNFCSLMLLVSLRLWNATVYLFLQLNMLGLAYGARSKVSRWRFSCKRMHPETAGAIKHLSQFLLVWCFNLVLL